MKLIKMRRSGKLVEVNDRKARVFVERLHVASYENQYPVVKKPVPVRQDEETPDPPKSERKNTSLNTGNDKPKRRRYTRRDMSPEE